jgi:8-oxo-dGTP diphosphatase
MHRSMIGNRPLSVWARDYRISLALLIYSIITTLACIHFYTYSQGFAINRKNADQNFENDNNNLRSNSMNELVINKASAAERGLGYEYEKGKCPYKFHGGSPNGKPRGSCWCGLDSYCMCTPSLAIDAIIEHAPTNTNNNDKDGIYVILVQRGKPPTDRLAIPGGFVDVGETVENAVIREVFEETALKVSSLEQFHVYSDPNRDQRRHTVSVVFRTIVDDITSLHRDGGDDAKGVQIININNKNKLSRYKHDSNSNNNSGSGSDSNSNSGSNSNGDKMTTLAFDHFDILEAYIRHYHPTLAQSIIS